MPNRPTSVVIARSVRVVFAFVADCTQLTRWYTDVAEVSAESTWGARPGTTHRVAIDAHGKRYESVLEVTALQEQQHIGLRCSAAGWQLNGRFLFEPLGRSTRVTFVPETPIEHGPVTTLLRRLLNREADDPATSLVRLRQLMEEPSHERPRPSFRSDGSLLALR